MSLWGTPKAAEKPKVMLLDDEKFLLMIYKLAFEKAGYEVESFSDVDTALAALRSGYEPSVILFDITMPDSRSGYEFIESVHEEKLAKKALKVALTNEGQDAEKARIMELGASEHLLKAKFTPGELVRTVETMVKMKKNGK